MNSARATPQPISSQPKPTPIEAATRVALWRSPVSFQAIARAIRPPSSGKAGTRLKTSRTRFIETSSESTTSAGVAPRAAGEPRGVPEAVRARDEHGRAGGAGP